MMLASTSRPSPSPAWRSSNPMTTNTNTDVSAATERCPPYRRGSRRRVGKARPLRQWLASPGHVITSHARCLPPRGSGSNSAVPSWADLEAAVPPADAEPRRVWDPVREGLADSQEHPPVRDGVAVLYRDRNGWCPYSERVWLGLTYKGVDFDEVLVDNQGSKPRFWYSMGGGSSTPKIRWPSGKTQGESLDILMDMDDHFPPETPQLLPDAGPEAAEAVRIARAMRSVLPQGCRPSSRAAFLYQSSGPVPRQGFEATLSKLDRMLEANAGPFFMGSSFSLADCSWVPFLERYSVQLPILHPGLDPRDPSRWPHLSAWYGAMEAQVEGYASRVQGDSLSWAAVLAEAGYGNAGLAESYRPPATLSFALGTGPEGLKIWSAFASGRPGLSGTPSGEAARRLAHNREAILRDFESQTSGTWHAEQADLGLRVCASCIESQRLDVLGDLPEGTLRATCGVAQYLLGRVCVPRDMGRLPADCYRSVLSDMLEYLPAV